MKAGYYELNTLKSLIEIVPQEYLRVATGSHSFGVSLGHTLMWGSIMFAMYWVLTLFGYLGERVDARSESVTACEQVVHSSKGEGKIKVVAQCGGKEFEEDYLLDKFLIGYLGDSTRPISVAVRGSSFKFVVLPPEKK